MAVKQTRAITVLETVEEDGSLSYWKPDGLCIGRITKGATLQTQTLPEDHNLWGASAKPESTVVTSKTPEEIRIEKQKKASEAIDKRMPVNT